MTNEIDSPWPFSTIGDELDLVNGFGFKPHQWKESGRPIVRIQNLNDHEAPFDFVQHTVAERFLVTTGDLLFAWSGSRGTSFGPFIWNRGNAVLNQHIFNVRFKRPSIDKTFSYWWLKHLVGAIEQQAHGSAGLVHITRKELEKFRFPVLDEPEQRKIARILTTLDNLIEKTESLIAKYQAIKQGMMHDLFTRGVDIHGRLRPPQTEAPDIYKQSELGWIPKEWEVGCLDDAIRIIDCKHYTPQFREEGIPFIRPRNVKLEGLDFADVEFVTPGDFRLLTDKHKPRKGDIVFSRNASFGVPCYIDHERRFAIGQDTVVMTEKQTDTKFVYYALLSAPTEKQVRQASTGSTFGRINLAFIRELLIPIPHCCEQLKIAEMLDAQVKPTTSELSVVEKLRIIKAGLMQDLLTGKIRVKMDEAEEVAAHV